MNFNLKYCVFDIIKLLRPVKSITYMKIYFFLIETVSKRDKYVFVKFFLLCFF